MDVFWFLVCISALLFWKDAAGECEFPLILSLTTSPEDVVIGGEVFLSCSSPSTQLVLSATTLTINGQDIGGFERDFLNDEQTTLPFATFDLLPENHRRVAQCHFNDKHSNTFTLNITDATAENAPIIYCDFIMEVDLLTVTCNIANFGSGVYILRVDGGQYEFNNITDPTQNSTTFNITEVSKKLFNQSNCVTIQVTFGAIGSRSYDAEKPPPPPTSPPPPTVSTLVAATTTTMCDNCTEEEVCCNSVCYSKEDICNAVILIEGCEVMCDDGISTSELIIAIVVPVGVVGGGGIVIIVVASGSVWIYKRKGKRPDASVAVAPPVKDSSEMKDYEAAS